METYPLYSSAEEVHGLTFLFICCNSQHTPLRQHYQEHREPWLTFSYGTTSLDLRECRASSLGKVVEITDLFRFLSEFL
jgi:hypothetical protein